MVLAQEQLVVILIHEHVLLFVLSDQSRGHWGYWLLIVDFFIVIQVSLQLLIHADDVLGVRLPDSCRGGLVQPYPLLDRLKEIE